jgi:hypothetical protein
VSFVGAVAGSLTVMAVVLYLGHVAPLAAAVRSRRAPPSRGVRGG